MVFKRVLHWLLPQWYFFCFLFLLLFRFVCPLPFWLGNLLPTNALTYLPRTNTSSTPGAACRLSLSIIVSSRRRVIVPCRRIEAWHCARARHAVSGSSCRRRLVAFARGRYLVAHRERGDVAEPRRSEVDVVVNATGSIDLSRDDSDPDVIVSSRDSEALRSAGER